MSRYPFIVLEGTDGSGKTTFRKLLFDRLRDVTAPLSIIPHSWLSVGACEVLTRRKYHGWHFDPDDLIRAHITDKERLSEEIVAPHLIYRPVICDRWVASTAVYGQLLDGVPIQAFHSALLTSQIAIPDLCIYVDTEPGRAQSRLATRRSEAAQPWDRLEVQKSLYNLFASVRISERLWGERILWFDNNRELEEAKEAFTSSVIPVCLDRIAQAVQG